MLGSLAALTRALNRAGAAFACAALVGLAALITLQVVLRRLFGAPIVFTDEVSGYLLVLITYLALGYAMQEGDHIQVEIVVQRVPPRGLRWLRAAWCVVGLGLTGLLLVRTAVLALDSARLGAVSITSQIPLAPVQAVVPLGCALLFLQLLVQLLDAVLPRR